MHLYRLSCMKRIINIDWGSLEPCLTTHMCIQTTLFWIPFSVCSVFYYALKYIRTEKKSQCLITHRGSYVFSYSRRSFVCATSAQCSLFSSFCCRRITFLAMHCALCMCSTTSTERRANTNSFTCSFIGSSIRTETWYFCIYRRSVSIITDFFSISTFLSD